MNVSVLFIRGVLSELRSSGIDERFVAAGVDRVRLGDLSASVPIASWESVVQAACARSMDPLLAFHAGAHLPLSALQWLGFLLKAAPSLRESLSVFERYACLLAEPLRWELREEKGEAKLVCQTQLLRPETARFSVEFAFAVALHVGDRMLPGRAGAVQLRFAFAAPDAGSVHYGIPARFSQPENAIVFPASWLDEPWEHGLDGSLVEPFREYAEGLLLAYARRGLAERVRSLLTYQGDLSQFDASQLATLLNMNERMLRRRLAEEGAPLAEILGDVRRNVALREMQRSDIAIKALSEQLGFSEPSAFHRAFKRWTGLTPSEYLRQPKPGSDGLVMGSEEAQDALAEASGIFQVQEVAKVRKLFHDQA